MFALSRIRLQIMALPVALIMAITGGGAALAIDPVTEPSSPSQPYLVHPDISRDRTDTSLDRRDNGIGYTDNSTTTTTDLHGPIYSTASPPTGATQNRETISTPSHFLGRQQPISRPSDATKWPENVFKVGTVDLNMVTPGEMKTPPLNENDLVPLGSALNPLRIEASIDEAISLEGTLNFVLDHNLPIHISREEVKAAKCRYVSALGHFLPDFENEYQDQAQKGDLSINGALFISLHNPFIFTRTGLRQYLYRGGSVVYGALKQKHLASATVWDDKTTSSDALLEGTRRYYNTLLEEVLLQIRVKSVQVSNALLLQNDWLKNKGILTKLDVLQSKAQVARDKQLLIHEQIARRSTAIRLASYLNKPSFANFTFRDPYLIKTRLISDQLNINTLLDMAAANRPELRSAKERRIAAKNSIVIASAPLQPKVSVFGSLIGSGSTLSSSSNTVTLLPGVQNMLPAASKDISSRIRGLGIIGFDAQWTIGGMGVIDSAQIQAAKAEARKETLKETDQRIRVVEQVRTSFLSSIDADSRIEQTTAEVNASTEELRFAQERLAHGVGTSVDVINAQRDCTSSLVNKANAIIDFNIAQVQLLRDIGVINIERICSGKLLDHPPAKP